MSAAEIEIVRGRSYIGWVRSLAVEVDSVGRGALRPGGSLQVSIEPGPHAVRVTLGKYRVSTTVVVKGGERATLDVDVDSSQLNRYLGGGLVDQVRTYKAVMAEAHSTSGPLRITQRD
jgi:hypothetical protein